MIPEVVQFCMWVRDCAIQHVKHQYLWWNRFFKLEGIDLKAYHSTLLDVSVLGFSREQTTHLTGFNIIDRGIL